ncbi:MAG: (d)CMP kinase [Candidatus Babeliales bacterium]
MIITIDGPTASGKSSVAQKLAKDLNFYCLSSGYLYRALAYILLNFYGYSKETLEHLNADDIRDALDPQKFQYCLDQTNCGKVIYGNQDITPFLKSDLVSQGASIIAANKDVRDALNLMQRECIKQRDVVVEGRDSGSVVFDAAEIKFYLTAALAERARRLQELQKSYGNAITLKDAEAQIEERDTRDQERDIAPLTIPKNAYVVDNSNLTLDQTVSTMLNHVKQVEQQD